MNGQATTMTDTAVAADLGQTLDVERDFTAEVTLDGVLFIDHLTQRGLLIFGEVLDADVGIHVGQLQNVLCALSADAVDISQTDLDSLITGQVNTSNTCHLLRAPPINLVSAYASGFRKLP